jgi:hypothetical protein
MTTTLQHFNTIRRNQKRIGFDYIEILKSLIKIHIN